MRSLETRVDPVLFGTCFDSWIAALWVGRHDLIAIDGKTSRRTHDTRKDLKALHTLSAYASNARLVLAHRSAPEKANEITAIPDLLDHLAGAGHLEGALVTIDAMGAQVEIVRHGADVLLPLKGNQATLEADVADYFRTAPKAALVTAIMVEKGHGRIEGGPSRPRVRSTGSCRIERVQASPASRRSDPRENSYAPSTPADRALRRATSSRRPSPTSSAWRGARACWEVESMHWLLDVAFKHDLSRTRTGHGAKNMAVIRRLALNLVRANPQKGSVKTKRKSAG